MDDYTIFDKYNIPRPPAFSGMTGQGADAMYSVGGRWMKVGQATSDGYMINSYDPRSYTLGMTYQGVPVPVRMQQAVVKPYGIKKPYTPEFMSATGGMTDSEMELMKDSGIDRDQVLRNMMNNASSYMNDPTMKLPEGYGFSKEAFNSMRSNYYNNQEREIVDNLVDVVSLEDFKKLASKGDAKKGLYYVPYQTPDGEVDFQSFYLNEDEK